MNIEQPLPPPSRIGLTPTEYEVTGDRMAFPGGLDHLLHHPPDELRLAGAKLRAMFEADSTALDWIWPYDSAFYQRARGDWLRGIVGTLPATLLLWTVVHLVFCGDSGFHYLVVFIVALLAARGALALQAAVFRRRPSFRRGYAPA